MFIYTPLLLAMFISFHILSVFWAVVFPFHARSFKAKGHLKYVHLTMLLLALILPWGTVTVAFKKGTYGRFPPVTCYPGSNSLILYGITWPVAIMFTIDLSLIVIVLWVIIQLLQKKRREQGGKVNTTAYKVTISNVSFTFKKECMNSNVRQKCIHVKPCNYCIYIYIYI